MRRAPCARINATRCELVHMRVKYYCVLTLFCLLVANKRGTGIHMQLSRVGRTEASAVKLIVWVEINGRAVLWLGVFCMKLIGCANSRFT